MALSSRKSEPLLTTQTPVFCQNKQNNNVGVIFDENFYLACGGAYTNNYSNNDRIVIEFIFDGEKFVNTDDNC